MYACILQDYVNSKITIHGTSAQLGLNSHSLLFSRVMSYFLTGEFLKDYSDVFSQRLIIPWPFQQVSKAQRHQYLNKERQHAETQQGFLGS